MNRTAPWIVALAALVVLATDARAVIRFDSPYLIQSAMETNGDYPANFSLGDVNGDGIVDAVSHQWGLFAELVVSLGVGDGTFAAPMFADAPGEPAHGVLADFDADGSLDVGMSGWESAGVLFGDGSGANWESVAVLSEYGQAAAGGDFDGDGLADLVSISAGLDSGTVRTLLSRPQRTFEVRTLRLRELHGNSHFAEAGDFNRDGRLDVVVGIRNGIHQMVLLEGHGDGTFTARPMPAPASLWVSSLDVADANDDGLLDVLVGGHDIIAVYRGVGDGTFVVSQLPQYLVTHYACRFGDATGDGTLDIVSSQSHAIATWPGLGDGSFADPTLSVFDGALTSVHLADVNDDGYLDVVGMGEMGGLVTALGDGTGAFGNPKPPVAPVSYFVLVADMDGDGDDDIVSIDANGTTRVTRSDPGRTFASMPAVPSNFMIVRSPGIADFDGDGNPDIAMRRDSSKVRILRGHGDGTLSLLGDTPLNPMPDWFRVGEFSGDARADLLYLTINSIVVIPGRGDGSFDPPVVTPTGGVPINLAVGLLNTDSISDLTLTVWNDGAVTDFLDWILARGLGGGAFAIENLNPVAHDHVEVGIGDVNGDGRDDVLSTSASGVTPTGLAPLELLCRLQQSDGSLAPPVASHLSRWGDRFRISDVDGDGNGDLLSRVHAGTMVAISDGSGRLELESGYQFFWDYAPQSLEAGDFDADGALDLLQHGNLPVPGVHISYGRGDLDAPTIAFAAPAPPAVMTPGESTPIAWNASDSVGVESVDLFVSRRGHGGPFLPIALELPEDGIHLWTVTNPLSDSVVFKAVARDSAGNVGRATTSGHRSIVAPVSTGGPGVPTRFALGSVAPNPSRGSLSVWFDLPHAARVTAALYDVRGREVARIADRDYFAGRHTASWDGRGALPPGLYFLQLRAGAERATARVTVLD